MLAPLEVSLELKPKSIMLHPTPGAKLSRAIVLTDYRATDVVEFMEVHEALEELHKYVAVQKQESRTYYQRMHNSKTNVIP